MPQDEKAKHFYEHREQERKEDRAEQKAEDALNDAVLRGDEHTGQEGILPSQYDAEEGSDNKKVYALLPDWHKDELRRLTIVPRGTRLPQGDVYADLRFLVRGELVAHGEEEVHDELLVAKRSVDYEIWNKLLASG